MRTGIIWKLVLSAMFMVIQGYSVSGQPARTCLDVTFLVDPSDRVSTQIHPARGDKDRAAIEESWDEFQEKMKDDLMYFAACGRFRVFVVPQKSTPGLSKLAQPLYLNLRTVPLQNRRDALEDFSTTLSATLESLYSKAEGATEYSGSDVWGFFRNQLRLDTLIDGKSIVNKLVVLTDGYLYAEENQHRITNRFTYNVGEAMAQFRNNPEWKKKFKRGNYGFLPVDTDLHGADVLIMGFQPLSDYVNEMDVMTRYWREWLEGMGADVVEVHASSSLRIEQEIIQGFFRSE